MLPTKSNESDAETLIDIKLSRLGWQFISQDNLDNRNVWKRQPKNKQQKNQLDGLFPDYVLYPKNNDTPIAIIEAKKASSNLNKALEQGINYARKIGAKIVFASDGVFTRTYHVDYCKPLFFDGEEVKDFLAEDILLNFLNTHNFDRRNKKVIDSKNQLIDIFRLANKQLRQDGLTAGIERISVFSTLLFLKLISEIEEINHQSGLDSNVPKECVWDSFCNKRDDEILMYVNNISIKYFANYYGSDIFSPLNIRKSGILKNIVDMITPLYFSDINTDIKGDAFEFFLKTYNAGYKDLGEYFTPRHIIDLMVKLIDPKLGETIYDPFCGTGGILISAFKHIKEKTINSDSTLNILKQKTVYGNDITSTARIAKMNMILAGDGHNNIQQQDSLLNPQNKKYDIVLTNIPFSLNVDYVQNSYYLPSKDSNNICIQHCLNAVKDGGRLGLIVPDGVLTKPADSNLRQYIYENSKVDSVISLPAGLFSPYSDTVKTNIVLLKDVHSKQKSENKNFYYYRVKNDGLSFGTNRKIVSGYNDINHIEDNFTDKNGFFEVDTEEIEKNDYSLTASYKHFIIVNDNTKRLGDFCNEQKNLAGDDYEKYKVATVSSRIGLVLQSDYYKKEIASEDRSKYKIVKQGEFVYRPPGLDIGTLAINMLDEDVIVSNIYVVFNVDESKTLSDYLLYALKSETFLNDVISPLMRGSARPQVSFNVFKELHVPLPTIDVQKQIIGDTLKEIEIMKKKIEILKNDAVKNVNKLWE